MDNSVCFVCKETFKQVLKHLGKSPICSAKYPVELLNELKIKSKDKTADKKRLKTKEGCDPSQKREKNKAHYQQKQSVLKNFMKFFNPSAANYKNFFREIQYGPIFPCICCMKCFSDRGVKIMDSRFHERLTDAQMAHYIDTSDNLKINGDFHLCHTCHLKLSKKQMPKLCFQNGLKLSNVPECMQLSSLGNQLLAKYILFLKLREHKKSGYGILNDRVSYQYF